MNKYLKGVLLFFMSFLFFSCFLKNNQKRMELTRVVEIKKGIYFEVYCTYKGGVYAGDTHTCYLTDSISYRIKVGYYYDQEKIYAILKNDSIVLISKCDRNSGEVIKDTEYNLYKLQKGNLKTPNLIDWNMNK